MTKSERPDILKGVEVWNAWRREQPSSVPDFSRRDLHRANLVGADLSKMSLFKANLFGANLHGANLQQSNLMGANLSEADLTGADLAGAELGKANLSKTDLREANLSEADLRRASLSGANLGRANLGRAMLLGANFGGADLSEANLAGADLTVASFISANLGGADLSGADLSGAQLIETNLVAAILTGCRVYGVSAWNVQITDDTHMLDLVVAPPGEPELTTDDLEVAQFIYLMLHNEKLQRVIDTITSKVVLILGRFSPERKMVLDALRDELRKRNYVPVVFDFEKPSGRTTDETITLLARMARFVIADISDAKSVLQELRGIVPVNPTLPVQAIIVSAQEEPGMFDFFKRYPWFLTVHRYDDQAQLLVHLEDRVIGPVEAEVAKLR